MSGFKKKDKVKQQSNIGSTSRASEGAVEQEISEADGAFIEAEEADEELLVSNMQVECVKDPPASKRKGKRSKTVEAKFQKAGKCKAQGSDLGTSS
ncbi:hypothetical protein R1flu_026650 [Riccia fluitans]|uniref:Uncharacterized protein n=1 Tax=Riccia fluitans TaxID=41844 RepID=A0ABD1XGJ4_9MARC